jgi:nitroreductase
MIHIRRRSTMSISRFAVLIILSTVAVGQELKPIELPKPRTDGGRPLMQVLKERKTTRSFSGKGLPLPVVSDLLWAAFGVNRPESGKRTAPSAWNRQEIDIYVAMARGLYVYAPGEHRLEPVLAEDVRAMTGTDAFVKDAPASLVYVADFAKMGDISEEEKIFYSAANTGFIGQNVYLFCASEGLATVVRDLVDKPALAKKFGLRPEQKITLAQSVGYPKD